MRLFIAEKHDAAISIADALMPQAQQQHLEWHIICGVDVITWTNGHLYEQAPPEYYDPRYAKWKTEDLPIIPAKFEILPIKGREAQIATIHELIGRADVIVHACDPDREGQLIGAEVLAKAPQLPQVVKAMRLWPDALDESGVRDAIAAMRPNSEYLRLMLAALARATGDWLVGYNASRKCTLEARYAGAAENFNVGRVKTPTLKLIVARERQITAFVPTPFWIVAGKFSHPKGLIYAQWIPDKQDPGVDSLGRATDPALAQAAAETVKGKTGRIIVAEDHLHRQEAPLPLDLTELQIQAAKEAGLSAKETLAAAQALYQRHRIITYPRTSCRFLNDRDHAKAQQTLDAIRTNDPSKAGMIGKANLTIKSRAFDDSKAGQAKSHNAIVPTQRRANLSALTAHEQLVYDLVCRGYIAQFYPAHEYVVRVITIEIERELFEANHESELVRGWKELYPPKSPRKLEPPLPDVASDDSVQCLETQIVKKMTEPPRRYTSATLVRKMENIHEEMSNADPDALRRMAQVGLGTVATRAEIVENLIVHDKTVERNGIYLMPTDRGKGQIARLEPYDELVEPTMTAGNELMLAQIADGEMTLEEFKRTVEDLVRRIVERVRFERGPGPAGPSPKRPGTVRHKASDRMIA